MNILIAFALTFALWYLIKAIQRFFLYISLFLYAKKMLAGEEGASNTMPMKIVFIIIGRSIAWPIHRKSKQHEQ